MTEHVDNITHKVQRNIVQGCQHNIVHSFRNSLGRSCSFLHM